MILGAHQSIAGGIHKSVGRALADRCASLQIFTKSASQWAARPLDPGDVAAFRREVRSSGLPVLAHDSYLINLGSPDDTLWERSVAACAEELARCAALGIRWLVAHPGAPKEAGEAYGLERIALGLDAVFERAGVRGVGILLETTAGQGSNLGWRFEQIGEIVRLARCSRRLGVCFDTCHVYAAGYDFTTPRGYRQVWEEFDRIIGLKKLKAFHLNDSKRELHSRVDRHHRIGEGHIGIEPFRWLVNDSRFRSLPAVLETPPLEDGTMSFATGIATLRGLEDPALLCQADA